MRTAQRLSLLFRLILRKVDSEWSLCIGGQLRADFSVREGGYLYKRKRNELTRLRNIEKRKLLKPKEKEMN